MNRVSILLAATNPELRETLTSLVPAHDPIQFEYSATLEQVQQRAMHRPPAMILLHETHPSEAPLTLVRHIRKTRANLPILVLSDVVDPTWELELYRAGITEFLSRPLNVRRLALLLEIHTVEARLTASTWSQKDVATLGSDPFFYAPQGGMGRLMEQVRRIAPLPTTVLLGGETGTGKTRLASLLHELSRRTESPFLTVNCGVLSANLIESEMFGHLRGAFTGADRDRIGKFEQAGEGTLFLDDIDALPITLQAKLLRAVEDRLFEPVGGNEPRPFRARLIVASNRPLEREVAEGRFRSDLYYRLNVVSFALPPLRERRDMIPALAHKFVCDFSHDGSIKGFSPAALDALQAHDWPGNVRELRNVVERAVALCIGPLIQLEDLPDHFHPLADTSTVSHHTAPVLTQSKEETELHCITTALARHGNNRLRAAAALGISRMTLYKKLHKYGLMGAT